MGTGIAERTMIPMRDEEDDDDDDDGRNHENA